MADKTPRDYQWDGYAKGASDVPYDRELEEMNDKQLDIEIERSKEGSARRASLQRERNRRDREDGAYIFPVPPDEKFHQIKSVGRWFKKHVLAAVVIFILTTILGIYITRWLSPPQEKTPPQSLPAKAMPV